MDLTLMKHKIIAKTLLKYPKLKLQSICSHLAATDNPKKDEFTNRQFLVFDTICAKFFKELGYEG